MIRRFPCLVPALLALWGCPAKQPKTPAAVLRGQPGCVAELSEDNKVMIGGKATGITWAQLGFKSRGKENALDAKGGGEIETSSWMSWPGPDGTALVGAPRALWQIECVAPHNRRAVYRDGGADMRRAAYAPRARVLFFERGDSIFALHLRSRRVVPVTSPPCIVFCHQEPLYSLRLKDEVVGAAADGSWLTFNRGSQCGYEESYTGRELIMLHPLDQKRRHTIKRRPMASVARGVEGTLWLGEAGSCASTWEKSTNSDGVIWRSRDRGRSWDQVKVKGMGWHASLVLADAKRPGHLVALSGTCRRAYSAADEDDEEEIGGNLFVTRDGGSTWSNYPLPAKVWTPAVKSGAVLRYVAMVAGNIDHLVLWQKSYAMDDEDEVAASAAKKEPVTGDWITRDGGKTWSKHKGRIILADNQKLYLGQDLLIADDSGLWRQRPGSRTLLFPVRNTLTVTGVPKGGRVVVTGPYQYRTAASGGPLILTDLAGGVYRVLVAHPKFRLWDRRVAVGSGELVVHDYNWDIHQVEEPYTGPTPQANHPWPDHERLEVRLRSLPPPPRTAAGRAGMEWVRIPGGTVQLSQCGYDFCTRLNTNCSSLEVPVKAFEMARTEVTVGQYRACVRAGGCKAVTLPGGFDGTRQPMVKVTSAQAQAFCRWAGGTLPTEAQWQQAAGGAKGYTFPWGKETASCAWAVIGSNVRCDPERTGKGGSQAVSTCVLEGCGKNRTWPVCSRPGGNTVQGLCDMGGNVAEYVVRCQLRKEKSQCDQDEEDTDSEEAPPATAPKDPCKTGERITRGGSWCDSAAYTETTSRGGGGGEGSNGTGFRCTR